MRKAVKRALTLLLALVVLSTPVLAMTNTNKYISSVSAYLHKWSDGVISVEYHVVGTDIMDTIGAHRIVVYKLTGDKPNIVKDEIVMHYWYEYYPSMMGTNDLVHAGSFKLNVEPGERYYALLVFYATLDGGGDDMPYTTQIITA